VEAIAIPDVIREWDLGPGESAVLAYALNNPGTPAILDDLAGRRCAETLGLPLRGTVGLVLRAKQSGAISSALETFALLKSNGMYLSDHVINQVLGLVGERI
jgi:predicted nucleic acid-binding protein